jgi:uncharacterized protein (TIGR00369 family)
MEASAWLTSGIGTIYAGALAVLADFGVTIACSTIIPAATAFSPLDLKINFLRPALASDGKQTANAKLVHQGRSIAVAHCEVLNPEGQQVAIATESVLILPAAHGTARSTWPTRSRRTATTRRRAERPRPFSFCAIRRSVAESGRVSTVSGHASTGGRLRPRSRVHPRLEEVVADARRRARRRS